MMMLAFPLSTWLGSAAMRLAAVPEGLIERIGLLLNKMPLPVGESMYGMPVARCLQVAQRTGVFAALA